MSGDAKTGKAAPAAQKDDKKTVAELKKLIDDRVRDFCREMNKRFKAERDAAVAAAQKDVEDRMKKKAGGGKVDAAKLKKFKDHLARAIPSFTMTTSGHVESHAFRSGDDQASYIVRGWSHTCSSAHMRHAAMHVEITATRDGKSETIGSSIARYFPSKYEHTDHNAKPVWGIMSLATFRKIWLEEALKAKVANYSGNASTFAKKDRWHLELPKKKIKGMDEDAVVKGTRPGRADPQVQACVEKVAEIRAQVEEISPKQSGKLKTQLKGSSGFEKTFARDFKKAEAAEKKALAAEKRKKRAEIAKRLKAEQDKKDQKQGKAKKLPPAEAKKRQAELDKKIDRALQEYWDAEMAKRARKGWNDISTDLKRFPAI